jgi:hypothetical protein
LLGFTKHYLAADGGQPAVIRNNGGNGQEKDYITYNIFHIDNIFHNNYQNMYI